MTTATATGAATVERTARSRPGDIWRIVRLQAVNPSMLFGIPWLILGGALLVTLLIALILRSAGISDAEDGFRYSWAVLSPQWYLVAVGVQAVAFTFSFALGFGSTRRDYWLGTSAMFVFVSFEMAVAIATLVQVEKATNGWGIGAGMFDALWYGQQGWWFDFYSTFALQLLVLFIGASITTIYLRWRMRGMIVVIAVGAVLGLAALAALTFSDSLPGLVDWFASIGLVGLFTIALVSAAFWAVLGYFVIRRATPR